MRTQLQITSCPWTPDALMELEMLSQLLVWDLWEHLQDAVRGWERKEKVTWIPFPEGQMNPGLDDFQVLNHPFRSESGCKSGHPFVSMPSGSRALGNCLGCI